MLFRSAQDWQDAASDAERKRVIIDQIASLTDNSALLWHGTLVRGSAAPTELPAESPLN